MEKQVTLLSIQNEDIKHRVEKQNINNDFILIEDFSDIPIFKYPFKLDMLSVIVCTKGTGYGRIDMQPYNLTAPFVLIVRPGQIVNYEYLSKDFAGYCLMLSNQIASDFLVHIDNSLPIASAIREKPLAQLNDEDLKFVRKYFVILKKLMLITNNPYRLDVIKHLMMTYFYLVRPYFQILNETTKPTKQGQLVDNFTQLLRENYRHEHETVFYADKLNLTPKYLSQLIKSATGKSVPNWIEDFIILEAKALLKSTNMTVQQISNELNFPSQSSFGKYFKRITGISPSEYKNK